MRTLAVRIKDDLRAQLDVIAQLDDRSVTEEIRLPLEDWIGQGKRDPQVLKRAETVRADIERKAQTKCNAIDAIFSNEPAEKVTPPRRDATLPMTIPQAANLRTRPWPARGFHSFATRALIAQSKCSCRFAEEELIELAADGIISLAKIRAEIEQKTFQKEAVKEQLHLNTDRLKYGARKALAPLELLGEPETLYRNATGAVRRDLLSAFFSRLIIYVENDTVQMESERNYANKAIHKLQGRYEQANSRHAPGNTKTPQSRAGNSMFKNPKAS